MSNNKIKIILLGLVIGWLLGACSKVEIDMTPVIETISPEWGLPGSEVTISGNHFSAIQGENTVYFNGEIAEIVSLATDELIVVVPEAASSGKISVSTAHGQVSSGVTFDVLKDFPRQNLVAFYPFNGNADDISGNALHGTNSGAMATMDRFGNPAGAFMFDGIDDMIKMGNPLKLQITGAITINVWVQVDVMEGGLMMVSKRNENGDGYYYRFSPRNEAPHGVSMMVFPADGGMNFSRGSFEGSSLWKMMTITLDGNVAGYYENGQLIGDSYLTNHAPLSISENSEFAVGSMWDAYFFKGKMDDLAVYDVALSQEEISRLYEQTVTSH